MRNSKITHRQNVKTVQMKKTYGNLDCKANPAIILIAAFGIIAAPGYGHAAVTARGGNNARISVTRTPTAASRMPTMTTTTSSNTTTVNTPPAAPTQTPEPAPVEEPANIIIENKASQFDDVLSETNDGAIDAAGADLAEKIRRQRAALDAESATAVAGIAAGGDSANACDQALRTCMKEKCGKDYTDCAKDGDTLWGTKMDACRTTTECSANEFAVLSVEIKADRDMNVKLGSYNAILECGNSYNSCMEQQCGPKLSKCLGKKNMDTAVAECDKIAKNCIQQDSGLASRMMEVIATLRQDAEKQVKIDEQRLYDLRDQMAAQCRTLGAAFDDRSLDCVFTVNFFANNSSTPYATRRAYAGNTFSCTQDWFGVDVTTFKENAMRLTRDQTSESMGKMGDGLGAAVGMVTSGVVSRGIDRYKAEKAVKDAKKQKTKEDIQPDTASDNAASDNTNTTTQTGKNKPPKPDDDNGNKDQTQSQDRGESLDNPAPKANTASSGNSSSSSAGDSNSGGSSSSTGSSELNTTL